VKKTNTSVVLEDDGLDNKILVTGGAGFIGSHLVDRLINEGINVVVLDDFTSGRLKNLSSHFKKPNFHLVEGDVRNKSDVRKALTNIEIVLHLAANANVDYSMKNPALVNEINVGGTLNILEKSLNTDIKKIVYASSCAVYGEPNCLPVGEEHPTKPLSPYGITKLAAEHYCRVFYEVFGLKTICLRFFNVYGPSLKGESYSGVIAKFLNRLKRGKPPIIYGNGEQTRDFVHVKDVVEAIMLALNRNCCDGEVINVGSGITTKINQLASVLIELTGRNSLKPTYAAPREGDITNIYADINKARKMLGYTPSVRLKEGLITCLGK
jgi:UDP-glucose 4-epimerase